MYTFINKYMYIYIYMYIYVRMCLCMYIYICIYVYDTHWNLMDLAGRRDILMIAPQNSPQATKIGLFQK